MKTVRAYRWNHTNSTEDTCIYEAIKPVLLPRRLEFKKTEKGKVVMYADGQKISYLAQFSLMPIDTNTFRAISRYRPETFKFCLEVNKLNIAGKFTCSDSAEYIKRMFKAKEV